MSALAAAARLRGSLQTRSLLVEVVHLNGINTKRPDQKRPNRPEFGQSFIRPTVSGKELPNHKPRLEDAPRRRAVTRHVGV